MNKRKVEYYQIDYLRLFRLCRGLGLVKGKRKVPAESKGGEKNACKRLMSIFIKHIFAGWSIKSDKNYYCINLPQEISNILSAANKTQDYYNGLGDEGTKIFNIISFFIFLPAVNLTAFLAGITIGIAAFLGFLPIFCFF